MEGYSTPNGGKPFFDAHEGSELRCVVCRRWIDVREFFRHVLPGAPNVTSGVLAREAPGRGGCQVRKCVATDRGIEMVEEPNNGELLKSILKAVQELQQHIDQDGVRPGAARSRCGSVGARGGAPRVLVTCPPT